MSSAMLHSWPPMLSTTDGICLRLQSPTDLDLHYTAQMGHPTFSIFTCACLLNNVGVPFSKLSPYTTVKFIL